MVSIMVNLIYAGRPLLPLAVAAVSGYSPLAIARADVSAVSKDKDDPDAIDPELEMRDHWQGKRFGGEP
jgi:hypothetical protein